MQGRPLGDPPCIEEPMNGHTVRLAARHDLTPDEIEELEQRIYEYNAARTGYSDASQISFTVHVADKLIGAAAGYTWAGMCELRQLWIDEEHRGQGYGRRLLLEFIEEARARRCRHIYVATYEFQAPRFYNRFGFRPVAAIKGRPSGHLDILLRLTLDRSAINDDAMPSVEPREALTQGQRDRSATAGLY
jgi:N-acetylglutamate synthase-like GNAT family acetyltransferase